MHMNCSSALSILSLPSPVVLLSHHEQCDLFSTPVRLTRQHLQTDDTGELSAIRPVLIKQRSTITEV